MPVPTKPLTRWLVVLPLIALLGWLVVTMARWGTADLQVTWAREQLDAWSTSTTLPTVEAWRRVRDTLAEARDLRPGDPDLHEQLGRLYALRAGNRSDPVAMTMLRQARASYEEALQLRPASPYTWAGLAWVLHRLGEQDSFFVALERADELGPWEREVQFQVLELAWATWSDLSQDLQVRVMATAGRALTRNAREVIRLANEYGQMPSLCSSLGTRDELQKSCSVQNN